MSRLIPPTDRTLFRYQGAALDQAAQTTSATTGSYSGKVKRLSHRVHSLTLQQLGRDCQEMVSVGGGVTLLHGPQITRMALLHKENE